MDKTIFTRITAREKEAFHRMVLDHGPPDGGTYCNKTQPRGHSPSDWLIKRPSVHTTPSIGFLPSPVSPRRRLLGAAMVQSTSPYGAPRRICCLFFSLALFYWFVLPVVLSFSCSLFSGSVLPLSLLGPDVEGGRRATAMTKNYGSLV